ncbi:MAG: TerC family protein [Deltaproteobacteria bacterium]|nr:TerC family protein [Deltaproteobacteria bacterium]
MFWHDLATLGSLAILEGLLSADNALVLAVLVQHLPPAQRKKALRYGIWGAFAFRIICVLLAAYLIRAWYFKTAGALYLLFLAGKNIFRRHDHTDEAIRAKGLGFWRTVIAVELTDIAFSIDSIIAAVAMSPKIWVIYFGGIAGIIGMRFVAGIFLRLIERFPGLERGAYLLVGWIGGKLAAESWHEVAHRFGPDWGWTVDQINARTWQMEPALFWLVMVTIFVGSMLWQRPKRRHA